jgi:hypothetical protein
MLNNPLPSPLNKAADTEPVIFTFAFIVKDEPDGVSIILVSTNDAENGIPLIILTEFGEASITGEPLT